MDELLQPPGTPYGDRYYENRFDELYAKLMGDPVVVSHLGDLQYLLQRHQEPTISIPAARTSTSITARTPVTPITPAFPPHRPAV